MLIVNLLLRFFSVTHWNIGETQNVQQNIDDLQSLLEKLGAKKSGLFAVECESFHSTNGKQFLFL